MEIKSEKEICFASRQGYAPARRPCSSRPVLPLPAQKHQHCPPAFHGEVDACSPTRVPSPAGRKLAGRTLSIGSSTESWDQREKLHLVLRLFAAGPQAVHGPEEERGQDGHCQNQGPGVWAPKDAYWVPEACVFRACLCGFSGRRTEAVAS